MAWGLSLVKWVCGDIYDGVVVVLLLCGSVLHPRGPASPCCGRVSLWFIMHLVLAYDLLSKRKR